MTIVVPLGRSVKQYLQWVVSERKNMVLHCPSCSCLRLHGHDHYKRWAVTRSSLHRIPIHRWHCPRCQKTVSVLPDLLVPYGRFVNNLRERAVRLVVKGEALAAVPLKVSSPAVSVVSARTVRRWVAAYRAGGLEALKPLAGGLPAHPGPAASRTTRGDQESLSFGLARRLLPLGLRPVLLGGERPPPGRLPEAYYSALRPAQRNLLRLCSAEHNRSTPFPECHT